MNLHVLLHVLFTAIIIYNYNLLHVLFTTIIIYNYNLLHVLFTTIIIYIMHCVQQYLHAGADREGGLWGCNPPKEKQRKAAAQCKRARILRASAAAWYRRASFYVVVL